MPNYANGSIYKIWSISTDEIYIGSTTQNLSKRMSCHIGCYKLYQKGKCKYVTSFKILGYGDARIELIEKVECKCKEELIAREGHYIRNLKCVNKVIPDRTRKEQQDAYTASHKTEKKKYDKEYNIKNAVKRCDYSREWYQKNKIESNKRRNEKITCCCGSVASKRNMATHKKSKKHLAFINSLN